MNNVSLGGEADRHRAKPWVLFAFHETIAEGMGARPTSTGLSGIHAHMTNSLNTPIEALEHLFPVRVRRYAISRGSGGAGKHRGGDTSFARLKFSPACVVQTAVSGGALHHGDCPVARAA
jgi:N-methylhydantoinase B